MRTQSGEYAGEFRPALFAYLRQIRHLMLGFQILGKMLNGRRGVENGTATEILLLVSISINCFNSEFNITLKSILYYMEILMIRQSCLTSAAIGQALFLKSRSFFETPVLINGRLSFSISHDRFFDSGAFHRAPDVWFLTMSDSSHISPVHPEYDHLRLNMISRREIRDVTNRPICQTFRVKSGPGATASHRARNERAPNQAVSPVIPSEPQAQSEDSERISGRHAPTSREILVEFNKECTHHCLSN
jgi:hypothetical protein